MNTETAVPQEDTVAPQEQADSSSDEDAPPKQGTLRDRVLSLAIPTEWTQELPNPTGECPMLGKLLSTS